MLPLFILAFFCWRIGLKAKLKGLNIGLWVFYTLLSFFAGLFVGAVIVSAIIIRKYGVLTPEELMKLMQSGALDINIWFMLFAGIGGYLFIRYRIDKIPLRNSGGDMQE